MIQEHDGVFHLATAASSYLFQVTPYGHLESIYYGERLDHPDVAGLRLKHTAPVGSSVLYNPADDLYCLDTRTLEWSGIGKGDYREPPAEIRMPDSTFVSDFVYHSHGVSDGPAPLAELPSAWGAADTCQTLTVTLRDSAQAVRLTLFYTVYAAVNVITRRVVLTNETQTGLVIRRLMSLMLDLPNRHFSLVTFHGGWAREAHRQVQPLTYGLRVQASLTGASSNRANPGFLLAEQGANEQYGRVYGFNLVYSGNHYAGIELSSHDLVRVMTGINPCCFEWTVPPGESFATPEAVMTFSHQGFNGLSQQFHDFINQHIVRGPWQNRERPIVLNSWEAHFFRFNHWQLVRQARRAHRLGIELFVLDDGWFGRRNSDRAGLGDYAVNRRKLPFGLGGLARTVNRLGLQFGLWLEPEMVNQDSDLYRAHPEYAVHVPGRPACEGRHQLVLDLCQPAVRDYIVESVRTLLASAPISYVKWDMNRHISDMFSPELVNQSQGDFRQGEFHHRYILGLYDVLRRIFQDRPDILLESCSSGGNRFDLGMLCHSPQIWASDNTDPIERLAIQGGLSYLYPPSVMGAHVSASPHQQTLRQTPLATRFNVAAFGCLGYELDLKFLSWRENRAIRDQVAFYKQHRQTLQYGRFWRFDAWKANQVHWQAVARDGREAVAGFFQTQAAASDELDILPLAGLEPATRYILRTVPQDLPVRRFGALINYLLPVRLNPESWLIRLANHYYGLPDCVESYAGDGRLLQAGVKLNNQFLGTGYNNRIRLLGDFGSGLYLIEAQP